MHFALNFFFQHGLAQLEGCHGDGQQADAFQNELELLLYRLVAGTEQGRPYFHAGKDNQSETADEKEQGDEDEAEIADFLQVFHRMPRMRSSTTVAPTASALLFDKARRPRYLAVH